MKLEVINERFNNIGDLADCFYSFFTFQEKLYSVHRKHRLFSIEDWPQKASENFSQIILTEYQNKQIDHIVSEQVICNGNDPRAIASKKNVFILSQGALHSNIIYNLTIFPEMKTIPIQLGNGVKIGKNWQPFIKNETLFLIDSIAPFTINKVDINTGIVSLYKEIETDFSLKTNHDNYTIFRGGTNGVVIENSIYGWGHATTHPHSHIPFIWEYAHGTMSSTFTNIYTTFKEQGYSIVDPTSFMEWDHEHFALGLSCSQRDWFYSQYFMNVLLIIPKTSFLKKHLPPFKLTSQHKELFFHATELDTLINSKIINGGRNNNQKKGCLVCGPSKPIDLNKTWTIELHYSSKNNTLRPIGLFDIYLTINNNDLQIKKTIIYGTRGKTKIIKLKFEPKFKGNMGLIQTRVFSNLLTDVTVYFFKLTYED